MDIFLQDKSFLLLILAIIALVGILIGWSLRASLSERPIIEAYERLEQDRNSLARLFAQLKDQHELRTNEIKKLTQEITSLRQEVSAFEMEKAVRHSVQETYLARIDKAEAEAAHYAEKIGFLDTQSEQIRLRNAQLLHDLDRLREELKAWMTLHRDFAGLQKTSAGAWRR
ncbi:MAG: hypothetical protein IPL65_14925 [Lewinellaceae bacterium]|nr:hypothetical protein [Lewinellaceae bacterium]